MKAQFRDSKSVQILQKAWQHFLSLCVCVCVRVKHKPAYNCHLLCFMYKIMN